MTTNLLETLRAWHRYGHWLEDLQTQGEAA